LHRDSTVRAAPAATNCSLRASYLCHNSSVGTHKS
jgi:hypothetical protein